ncbi:MAG: sugar phosphate isomerase/epimerase [Planctomycetaceae bacterium]|nr:sugar phosphate isomerase/epimerase [Planctomycetales bacterium]MCB9926049.1 sugar phosphate isomerase/epimerase [Planctomycetaceae bacterium]
MDPTLPTNDLSRRTFLAGTAGAAVWALSPLAKAANSAPANKVCAFVKFVQSLSYDELAEQIAEAGFDGIEATIRDKGQVVPEQAVDELPKLVEALKKHDLEVNVMASNVNRVDQPHTESVLRTAAALGIPRYRMEYYRYDLKRSVTDQLRELRPVVKDLAAMNRELGIRGVYQNHSGAYAVGATIWDLHELFRDYSTDEFGIAFDIRHATVEAGLSWPVLFNVATPHLGAVYIKDFVWDGKKPENVPLGAGRVDRNFIALLRKTNFAGPISLHVEYLPKAGVVENLAAMKRDLATLKTWLTEA